MTDEPKRPQAGEFWRTRGGEIRKVVHVVDVAEWPDRTHPIVTVDQKGDVIKYTQEGSWLAVWDKRSSDLVEHLPLCTGFEWTPDTWPKWCISDLPQFASHIMERTSAKWARYHRCDGFISPLFECLDSDCEMDDWREVTHAEALARLTPPAPAESVASFSTPTPFESALMNCHDCGEFRGHGHEDVCPMAWVTQDRVPVRVGDSGMWSDVQKWGTWSQHDINYFDGRAHHGWVHPEDKSTLSVRCRRKDLPPLPTPDVPDVGEGYQRLPKGTVLVESDEVKLLGQPAKWVPTIFPGKRVGDPQCDATYRRKLPAPEIAEPSPDPTAVWSEMRAPDNFHPVRLWLTAVGGVTWRYEHPSDRELFFNGKQLYTKDAPAVSAKHTSRSIDSSGVDERRS